MNSKLHTEEGLEQQVQIASSHLSLRGKVARWAAVAASVVGFSIVIATISMKFLNLLVAFIRQTWSKLT